MSKGLKAASIVSALFILFSCHIQEARAVDVPKPAGRINDFANVITEEYRAKLEALIREVDEKTSAEIAVVTVQSIAPLDEIGYARLIFDGWKPGKRGKDNGALILLAVKERRWRIETGYGLEGILPDGRCGEIGRRYMVPSFKAGNYGEGLYRGAAAIADIVAQDAHVKLETISQMAPVSTKSPGDEDAAVKAFFAYLFIPIFFFAWNLPWPVYIGLPFTLFCAFALSAVSPVMPVLIAASYLASMAARYAYWRNLPAHKRRSFFGPQDFGGRVTGGSGGWGSSGSGGGGFGGGGFGGGGFGGGGGGGGGAGGGF